MKYAKMYNVGMWDYVISKLQSRKCVVLVICTDCNLKSVSCSVKMRILCDFEYVICNAHAPKPFWKLPT